MKSPRRLMIPMVLSALLSVAGSEGVLAQSEAADSDGVSTAPAADPVPAPAPTKKKQKRHKKSQDHAIRNPDEAGLHPGHKKREADKAKGDLQNLRRSLIQQAGG